MTYSYNPGKFGENGKDKMRFELGDTLTDGGAKTCPLCDEEYEAVISNAASKRAWNSAKLRLLEAIMMKLSYQVDTRIDVLSYSFGERAKLWRDMYKAVKAEVTASVAVPTIAPSIMRRPPYFYAGMKENPLAHHGEIRPLIHREGL
jgi:hypothetical protein